VWKIAPRRIIVGVFAVTEGKFVVMWWTECSEDAPLQFGRCNKWRAMDPVNLMCCLVAGLLYYNTLDAGFVYDDRWVTSASDCSKLIEIYGNDVSVDIYSVITGTCNDYIIFTYLYLDVDCNISTLFYQYIWKDQSLFSLLYSNAFMFKRILIRKIIFVSPFILVLRALRSLSALDVCIY
jgi:hypothetical protein